MRNKPKTTVDWIINYKQHIPDDAAQIFRELYPTRIYYNIIEPIKLRFKAPTHTQ